MHRNWGNWGFSTTIEIRESRIWYHEKPLISTEDLELLAVFQGYRRGCGSDPLPQTNNYFFKNKLGYWIIATGEIAEPTFLGTVFNPKWNPILTGFEF